MNEQNHITDAKPEFTERQQVLVALLVVIVWAVQVRYPPLSYPAMGLFIAAIIGAMTLLLSLRVFGLQVLLRHPAFLPGFLFAAWTIARWAIAGWPSAGASEVGTTLWAACYFIIAATLGLYKDNDKPITLTSRLPSLLLFALMTIGLLCGLHAVWQYHFSYAETYQALLKSLGNRTPDRTELGILYHLKLRRVASVWGDPNALATFSAVALCAALEVTALARGRYKSLIRGSAVLAAISCGAAIFYSGSRGGVLDAVLVLLCYAVLLLLHRGRRQARTHVCATFFVVLMAGLIFTTNVSSTGAARVADLETSATKTISDPVHTGWVWRSNTIRERLYYLQVGAKMIQMSPLTGLGPGGVDLYFGRLKSPEARETRHLHNWVAQTWSELGLVGLVCLSWFLGAIAWTAARSRLWLRPADRALTLIFVLIVFDGLMQISWNERELMSLFAIVCGLLTVRTGQRLTEPPSTRKYLRLVGCIIPALLFLVCETRYLVGESSKQIAYDAMYMGDVNKAERLLTRASRWIPNDPEPYAARASIAMDLGRLSASQLLINRALEVAPQSASIHVQAARIAEQLRRPDRVDKFLTKALELYPSNPEYNYVYAQHLVKQDSLTKALDFAQIAAKYNFEENDQAKYDTLVQEINEKLKGTQPDQ